MSTQKPACRYMKEMKEIQLSPGLDQEKEQRLLRRGPPKHPGCISISGISDSGKPSLERHASSANLTSLVHENIIPFSRVGEEKRLALSDAEGWKGALAEEAGVCVEKGVGSRA